MTIRLSRSVRSKNGTSESSSSTFEKDSLLLGRGGESDIILEGREISLQHARISKIESSYVVEDLDSLSGIMVNGKLARRQVLKNGDILKLADHVFTVKINAAMLELFEAAKETQPSAEESLQKQIEALSFKSAFPSIRVVSLICVLGALAASAYPYLAEQRLSWSSGPVTNHHRMIEATCNACHEGTFSKVSDQKCGACHKMSLHTEAFQTNVTAHHAVFDRPCVSCHQEHDGEQALTAKESALCVSCHAAIKTVLPTSKVADVANWGQHPEFSALSKADTTHLKLNHELHLKAGLRGKDGLVTLQCNDCHKLTTDRRNLVPLSMEQNCSACHPLGFDERLPEASVPHGSPDLVYKYLYAEYAKLMLAPADEEVDSARQRPGSELIAPSNPAFARGEIIKLARNAEKELFTRTACKLCHEVSALDDVSRESDRSQFKVIEPKVPTLWMPAARFSHAAHEEVACESCHHNVRTSTQTQDVLLPKVQDCRICHSGHTATSKVKSDCVDCHSYHDSLPLEFSQKRSFENIVSTLGNGK